MVQVRNQSRGQARHRPGTRNSTHTDNMHVKAKTRTTPPRIPRISSIVRKSYRKTYKARAIADASISEPWRCSDRALALRDEAFPPARGPTPKHQTPVATFDPHRPMKPPGDRRTIVRARDSLLTALAVSPGQLRTHISPISHTHGDPRARDLWANLGFTPVNPGREIASYLVARGPRS
jgi:hypothetical protein